MDPNFFGEYLNGEDENLKPEHVKEQEEINLCIECMPCPAMTLNELRIERIKEYLNGLVGTREFDWQHFGTVVAISQMTYEELMEGRTA